MKNFKIIVDNSFYRPDVLNIFAMENSLTASTSSQVINADVSIENYESDGEVRIDENDAQSSVGKPKKTRALVYKFFEWDDGMTQYKCKLCE